MDITLKSGKILSITASRGSKPARWNPSGNHYRVTVKVGRKGFIFDFWDSFHNRQKRIPCNERGAVACWAGDVFAGMNATDALDICEEFGYTDPKEARRVFSGAKQAQKQAKRMGFTEEELQELADY